MFAMILPAWLPAGVDVARLSKVEYRGTRPAELDIGAEAQRNRNEVEIAEGKQTAAGSPQGERSESKSSYVPRRSAP